MVIISDSIKERLRYLEPWLMYADFDQWFDFAYLCYRLSLGWRKMMIKLSNGRIIALFNRGIKPNM